MGDELLWDSVIVTYAYILVNLEIKKHFAVSSA